MGFIQKTLQPLLKHSNETMIEFDLVQKSIWYSSTVQSYIQRTIEFDNSWMREKKNDKYVLEIIKDLLGVCKVQSFEKVEDCNNAIDLLTVTDIEDDLLFFAEQNNNKDNLFDVFVEGVRNGFAHGTFNNTMSSGFLLISQMRSKSDAPVKFFLRIKNSFGEKLNRVICEFSRLAKLKSIDAKYDCITKQLQVQKHDDYYWANLLNCRIIIDDNFRHVDNAKYTEELKNLAEQYEDGVKTYVIVEETIPSQISLKNKQSKSGNVSIVNIQELV